ncbi:MAG TPA: hypothetical protein VLC49_13705 [Solirubrobacteraceae bacterium]|nr:hypothetical protein [Solirubrobacteraceae bacterium]
MAPLTAEHDGQRFAGLQPDDCRFIIPPLARIIRTAVRGLLGCRASLVLLVFVAASFGAWTALAQVIVPTTSCPLPGSQFQGGDGNQADESAACPATGSLSQWIDWQGLQADGRVGHSVDPNAQDSYFEGGNAVQDPGGWGIRLSADGVSPATDNILDVYDAFDRAPGEDGFLYLAFTREATSGTTSLSFELNQNPVPRAHSNGFPLPCRETGDILISFIVSGSDRSVEVFRWNTTTHTAPSPVHPHGCALTGTLATANGLVPNEQVQGSYNNNGPINGFLPIGEPGLVLTPGTNTIEAGRFAEAAINLTKALSNLDDGCRAFGSIWAHSRSSTSVTSALKDYVRPEPFNFNTCKATPTLTSHTSGATSRGATARRHARLTQTLTNNDTAVLSGGDNPTGTLTFRLYGPNNATCTGTPADEVTMAVAGNGAYQVPSFTPTAPGVYRWRATYSGDANNNPAGPTPCGEAIETIVITKASTHLTTTASGPRVRRIRGVLVHSGRAGGQIYDSATLSGGYNPTGTITFRLYGPRNRRCRGTPIHTSTAPVNGSGTYLSEPFTLTRAGTYRWVATYSGDDNNHPAGPTACGDPDETIVIARARPTLTTQTSGATDFPNPISDSAALDGGADPTGMITFRVYGPNNADCSGRPAHVFRVRVNGNGVYHSGDFTPPAVGTYRWVASYSGDGFNARARTTCGDPAEEQVVAHPIVQPSLSTRVVASTALAPTGLPIRDTATLSGGSQPPAPAPGGHIVFKVFGPDDTTCSHPAARTSVVAVSGNGNYTSGTFTPTEAGIYRWVAFYTGDALNRRAETGCGDPTETITVTRARPSISTSATASVTLPGFVRDAATLHGVNPSGTIEFELFGPNDPTCSGTPAFRAVLNVVGNSVYRSPRFFPRAAGTYRWVATYSGDDNNNPAATACGESGEITEVLPHHPSLITSASPPARLHPAARRVRTGGLSIYDSATLRGFRPAGEIVFNLYGPNDDACAGPPIFTTGTAVNGSGIYNSERFTPTASGSYRWRAIYLGDANNKRAGPTACDDPAEAVHVTVPAHTSLITSASDTVALGGAIHDTAILSGGSDPTGTITFKLFPPSDAPNDVACSGKPIFTSTVGVHGNGAYTSGAFVPSAAGAYLWVADYSGDHANHPASTACRDAGETGVVRPPDITPVTPALSTTISPSPGVGAPMFDTAHLTGGIDPGGAITFTLFGPNDASCSGPPVFTAVTAVNGNGDYHSAPFTVLRPGTYRWIASYAGDALNTPVVTACGDPAETAVISAAVSPDLPEGPNVPTPPKPKPKPKPKPPPPPTKPIVTG